MTANSLSEACKAISPALGNHLWQSTLFAIAAGLLTLILRNNHARIRYLLWLTASVKFLVPFSLLAGIGSHIAWWRGSPGANAGVEFAGEWLVQDVVEAYSEDGEVGERELLRCASAGCRIGYRDGAPSHVGQVGRRNCGSELRAAGEVGIKRCAVQVDRGAVDEVSAGNGDRSIGCPRLDGTGADGSDRRNQGVSRSGHCHGCAALVVACGRVIL